MLKSSKKLCLFLGLCTLLFVGLWDGLKAKTYPMEESTRLFSSDIYMEYTRQLKTFILQHPLTTSIQHASPTAFNSTVQKLLLNLEKPLDTPLERRSYHEAFVTKLRQLASMMQAQEVTPEDLQARQFIKDLVSWVFLQADLNTSMQHYLDHYLAPPDQDLLDYLPGALKKLQTNPQFNSIQREFSSEDQLFQGNLPSVLPFQETRLVRFGQPFDSPSRFFFWQTPMVYPEFLLFLQTQPSHLYINLMKRKGMESSLSHALEVLEKQVPQLYMVSLDKNSPFYLQKEGDYPETWETQAFKKAFLNQMSANNGHYFWSRHLDADSWHHDLHQLVEKVHQRYFYQKTSLKRNERQDFIELTYLEILDELVRQLHPASMNITCKQCMDRGPSLAVLWMFQKKQATAQELAAMLLAPPIIIHNRPSHVLRIERFVSAAKRIRDIDGTTKL